jgi:EmrB/QacA subfamily drug resistance transporter
MVTATVGDVRRRSTGRRILLLPVGLAAFITTLDNTVVNVALPSIQRDLRLSTGGLEWITTSYILAFASLLFVGGRATDMFGRRRVFLVGLAAFTTFSCAAGLAVSGGTLIAARALQGIGGALVLPSTLAIVSTDLDESDRDLGTGVLAAAIAAALALGPAVGGTVSEYLRWNWIFYLNAPVCMMAIILGARHLDRSPDALSAGRRTRVDLPGLATSAVALFAVTYALIEGTAHGFTSRVILGSFVVAGLAAVAFIVVERRLNEPMMDVTLLRLPVFVGGTIGQILWGLGVNGVFFYTSIFLQGVLGFSPVEAGLAFVPLALVLVLFIPVATYLAAVWGVHWTVAVGLGLVAWGLYLTAHVGVGAGFTRLLPGMLVIGAGSGLTTPLAASVLGVLPAANAGMAAALMSASREVSGVFGVALTGAILASRERALIGRGLDFRQAFVAGYARGLEVAAVLVALGGVVSLVTLRPIPRHRRGIARSGWWSGWSTYATGPERVRVTFVTPATVTPATATPLTAMPPTATPLTAMPPTATPATSDPATPPSPEPAPPADDPRPAEDPRPVGDRRPVDDPRPAGDPLPVRVRTVPPVGAPPPDGPLPVRFRGGCTPPHVPAATHGRIGPDAQATSPAPRHPLAHFPWATAHAPASAPTPAPTSPSS